MFQAVLQKTLILLSFYPRGAETLSSRTYRRGQTRAMPAKHWIFPFLVFSSLLLQWTQGIAVMSVDLGSEWMKIAIVSPGVPMEIALNKESKRKTPVTIAFRDGERLFGEDAQGVGVRFPKLSYSYILDLLGKRVDHPLVQLFQQRFPYYDIVADPDRGTVLFQHDSDTQFSPEQLIAQLLAKARDFAVESARQPVNEAVLTVPGFFNQVERKALMQAAELAGIKVLQLMNDYTAVALNYGIFRRKDFNETAQYIIFYDMGASSTTATVVSYQLVKTKEKGFVETNPQLTILGIGYDRTLGGLEMQLRLRDYLGKKFNEMKKTPNDVFKSPRALAKLYKEAGRLKNILSANAEHHAQVENLLDDQDFKLLVTRDDFEALCGDLFDRVAGPIHQALKTSGLTMDVMNQVILVGAGTRVPKVQEKLTEVVGTELGKNLNTDEAAAMGAVYKAADLSTGFKVKKFITKDAVIFPIQVVFERSVEGQIPKQVKRLLFGLMNPYPQKKVLTFNKHTEDFEFYINYSDLDHLPENEILAIGPLNLSKVVLSGVAPALSKHLVSPDTESKGIKAHFTLDESGILTLINIELVLEKTLTEDEVRKQEEAAAAAEESPLSKLGSTISNFFTGNEEGKLDSKEEKADSQEEEAGGEEKREDSSPEDKSNDSKKEEENKEKVGVNDAKDTKKDEVTKNTTAPDPKKPVEKKPKIVVIKEPIEMAVVRLGVTPLSPTELEEVSKRLEDLNEFDRQRVRRASALNSLEAFVFDAQNKLDVEEYQHAATEEETEKIRVACSEVSDWLYEEGLEADAQTYEKKLTELKSLTQPLYKRVKEHQERPGMLDTLTQALNGSVNFLVGARNMSAKAGEDSIFTEVELETLEKVIQETEEWKTKMEKEQAALKLSDNPKLSIKAIAEKLALLDREVKYLVNKAKIWRPPKAKEEKEKEKESINDTNPKSSSDKEQVDDSDFLPEASEPLPLPDKQTEDIKEKEEPIESQTEPPSIKSTIPPTDGVPSSDDFSAHAVKFTSEKAQRYSTWHAKEDKEEDAHTEL